MDPSNAFFPLRTVMDGADLDIEKGSHKYYPDFVREMRRASMFVPR